MELHLPGPKGQGIAVTVERFPGVNRYVLQVEAFGRAIREGAAWPVPLEFSRDTQEAVDTAFAMAEAVSI